LPSPKNAPDAIDEIALLGRSLPTTITMTNNTLLEELSKEMNNAYKISNALRPRKVPLGIDVMEFPFRCLSLVGRNVTTRTTVSKQKIQFQSYSEVKLVIITNA
jgi:hypothetical protein